MTQSTTRLATPDVAYDSDPSTGFAVYDSYNNGTASPWSQFGGTSAAAPQWAALTAIVDQGRAIAGLGSLDGPKQLLPAIYKVAASDFHDVIRGTSTGSPSYSAVVGYDLVTGRGTPIVNLLVADLAVWGAFSTPTTAPTVPTSFIGTGISATQISLAWGASTGADGYRLYRISGSADTFIASYSATTTAATVGSLTAGTTYSFRLDAYNSVGTASATTQGATLAVASITAPVNVTAKVLTKTSVQLSWTASTGANGYYVLWSNGTTTKQLASVNSRTTSVNITGLKAGSTNLFAVKAYDATSSATSSWVSLVQPAALQAPQGVSLTLVSATAGFLTWVASVDARGYQIYAIDGRGRTASASVGAGTTSVSVSGLQAGSSYKFCVVAVGEDESVSSDWISVVVSGTATATNGSAQPPTGSKAGCQAMAAAFASLNSLSQPRR